MMLLLFFLFVGCAVKCDESEYYVIVMPGEEDLYQAQRHLKVYWNVPTMQCKTKNISKQTVDDLQNLQRFGIIQNKNDSFRGNKVSILYDPGFFPALLRNESSGKLRYRNGGVPQEGNLELHLKSFRSVLNQSIPDEKFSGIAIIDFESWRPIFRQNFGDVHPYKSVSIEVEQERHWWWPQAWVTAEAKRRFEEAARTFMQTTISVAKQMRPRAKWGYYGFPYCFNMAANNMNENCASNVRAENNQIEWLWTESTALYPSVYSAKELSSYQLSQLISGRVKETARVRKGNTPILPYFWFRYRNGDFLSETDLQTALKTFNQSEASGFIIWGSSNDVNTVEKCNKLNDYINKVLGPAVAKYTKNNYYYTERFDDDKNISQNNKITTTTENFQNITTTTTPATTNTVTTTILTSTTTFSPTTSIEYTTENAFIMPEVIYDEDDSTHGVTVREVDYVTATEDSYIEDKSAFKNIERVSEVKGNSSSLIGVINLMFKFLKEDNETRLIGKTETKGDEQNSTFDKNLLETNVSDLTTTETCNCSDCCDAYTLEKSLKSLYQVAKESLPNDLTTENVLTTIDFIETSTYLIPDILRNSVTKDRKKGLPKREQDNEHNMNTEIIVTNLPSTTNKNKIYSEDEILIADDLKIDNSKISKDIKKGLPIHTQTTESTLKMETNLTSKEYLKTIATVLNNKSHGFRINNEIYRDKAIEKTANILNLEATATENTHKVNKDEDQEISKDVTAEVTLENKNREGSVLLEEENMNNISKDNMKGKPKDKSITDILKNYDTHKNFTENQSEAVANINITLPNQDLILRKVLLETNKTVDINASTEIPNENNSGNAFENLSTDSKKGKPQNTLYSKEGVKSNDKLENTTRKQGDYITEVNSILLNQDTLSKDSFERHIIDEKDISNTTKTDHENFPSKDQRKGLPKHILTTANLPKVKGIQRAVDSTEAPTTTPPKKDKEESDTAPAISSLPESLTSSASATADQVVVQAV